MRSGATIEGRHDLVQFHAMISGGHAGVDKDRLDCRHDDPHSYHVPVVMALGLDRSRVVRPAVSGAVVRLRACASNWAISKWHAPSKSWPRT
jgi:hypothetical protein